MRIQVSGKARGTRWAEGDVLMWDNIGIVHNASPDYLPDESRYIRRIQVMATKDYAAVVA
jgi:alpha-ketoglutarate-dependent taurine dioxygenase